MCCWMQCFNKQFQTPFHAVRRRLSMKSRSSAVMPLFFPGHLSSPTFLGYKVHFSPCHCRRNKRSGSVFFLHVHCQAPFSFSACLMAFSRCASSFLCAFSSPSHARQTRCPASVRANFRCPYWQPFFLHLYIWMSVRLRPRCWQALHTICPPRLDAFSIE